MGIKLLNAFLKRNCCRAIEKKGMVVLRNKTIVIDASIYLYKYHSNNELIDGIYQMILSFQKFNIKPIYVFDGKPPPEKLKTITNRRLLREAATQKLNEVRTENMNSNTLRKLEKRTTKINKQNVESVKELLTVSGIDYYQAIGEADELCVQLVKNNIAWACLSEDMDMFVHGCPRVLRGFNIFNDHIMLYTLNNILVNLNITFSDFQKLCILSGTDYNDLNIAFKNAFTWYDNYTKSNIDNFTDWLKIERGIVVDTNMFDEQIISFQRVNGKYNRHQQRSFLEQHDFIFDI